MRFKRINESVKVLTEDKTVNPGGTPYPNHGWCVIVCGGPGMGKSSVVKNLINIDAKHLDIDEVKALWLKTTSIDDGILTTADGREYSMGAENISEPYDLSNPKFTSFVHQVTKPLAKNRQNAFIKAAGSHDKEKLPNVIFDITGDKPTEGEVEEEPKEEDPFDTEGDKTEEDDSGDTEGDQTGDDDPDNTEGDKTGDDGPDETEGDNSGDNTEDQNEELSFLEDDFKYEINFSNSKYKNCHTNNPFEEEFQQLIDVFKNTRNEQLSEDKNKEYENETPICTAKEFEDVCKEIGIEKD